VAIVSDAGTPGINDPGFRIVQKAIEGGAEVVPIPGAVAFVNAVIASGLATDSIYFGGFLPSKTGDRKKRLQEAAQIPGTLVFYETPHRIAAAIRDARDVLGDRRAAIGRELTKLHEEFLRGTLGELAARLSEEAVRGEMVLVIDRGHGIQNEMVHVSLAARVAQLEAEGMDHRAALKHAAKERGMAKSEAYRLLQSEKQ
jgi:16S rRNA (cytidine1402-2'-O)-methyltransferase